ncbi:MAG: G-D-S-L family lipolytic protein [Chitinophagaceae bacterium]|jgi:lysophospholipase L1-like esterase|nr:G-D-S-L family lipolytic protein [Chitinophagaceae bacterium]MBK7679018.1 G-D-S-L family lipolytic protein [Chitinophagaceae bacterium]MBK8299637.1 G-D-S-L family lipolytic protein [Chitinophagaceae bacterium]MBK9463688.1 G-D-S-L family lipolytic protein [Chitinophagaceae bacterium]MBK9659192.1 G-D-S-L family lipolytic protein [Chitinophagaceae bacterium]
MKRILSLILFVILGFAFISQKKTKVIFFGDSITELGVKKDRYVGYILKMDSMLKAEKKDDQYELTGSGISANKVYDLYLRLEDDVLSKNPDVVVIYVGVNDVWHKTLLGTGTDADKFEKFYQAIIKKLKDKNIKVILCTPAVVGEKSDMSNPLDGDLNRYSNIIRDLAKKNELPLVDLRKKFLDYLKDNNPENKEKDILTYDRVHMNNKGNQFLADAMWKVLKDLK